MALQSLKPTKYGIDATYFKITNVQIDWLYMRSNVVIWGYSDQEHREAKNDPLIIFPFKWDGDLFPFTTEGKSLKEAYEKIKTLPGWEGSLDI